MRSPSKRFPAFAIFSILVTAIATAQQPAAGRADKGPDLDFPTVLYGAAYYNEYMPGDQNAGWTKTSR